MLLKFNSYSLDFSFGIPGNREKSLMQWYSFVARESIVKNVFRSLCTFWGKVGGCLSQCERKNDEVDLF